MTPLAVESKRANWLGFYLLLSLNLENPTVREIYRHCPGPAETTYFRIHYPRFSMFAPEIMHD
jgi:hypothetical protein